MKQMLNEVLRTIRVPTDLYDCVLQAIKRVKQQATVKNKKDKEESK